MTTQTPAGPERMRDELQQLRRGHGVHSLDLHNRIGPLLRAACGITPSMPRAEARDRLVRKINEQIPLLPGDLRIAVQAALALAPATEARFLRARMDWLGSELDRDPRTALRRVESGLTLLAERLSGGEPAVAQDSPYAPDGWYVESMRSTLRLYADPVQLLETRVITSLVDGLEELTVSWSAPADLPATPDDLHVTMLYGGVLVRDEVMSTSSYWSGKIRLPRPIGVNECHEYQVEVMSFPRRLLRPYYVLTPFRRIDEFELRAKFDGDSPPAQVWRVDGVPFQLLEENQPVGKILELDAAGEVVARFDTLQQGLSYGLRWRSADAGDDTRGP